jgi:anti-anti-sigma factor
MARNHAPFSISRTDDGGTVVFVPRGELDLATAPELEEAVLGELDAGRTVVIDLRQLEFMDSSGVRVLIAAHAKAGDAGERLSLVRPPRGGTVARILEIAGVEQALRMVDDEDVGQPPAA